MNLRRYTLVLGLLLLGMTTLQAKMNVSSGTVNRKQSPAKVAETCPVTSSQIDLDINQVRARVLVGGDLWWDPVGQIPYYEVPIGSNKNSLYSGALWIGGIDKSGALKVAAQTYRQQGGNDFWGGPISRDPSYGTTGGIQDARCAEFDRFWPITRREVEDFINGGEATKSIREWPGNGNVSNGELPFLAPYFDADNSGTYDYQSGDYPYFLLEGDYPLDPGTGTVVCNDYLFGDKSIWWVFNDVGNVKTETASDAIGLEVRAQAFAFRTADEVNYMTFYKYQVINRSSDSLTQTYFGVWCDPDLGNASDDYVGCDVGLGLGYCYNGDPNDEGGGGYGLNPPAVGIDFFQGPLADIGDNIDNDKDGTVDEPGEQIIMSKFVFYKNVLNTPDGNPATTDDYYEYLSGFWLDGQQITFGEQGRNPANPPTDYMFSNGTDPAFPAQAWTMVTAGVQPDDMRWLQSAGVFSLAPGAVNYITTGVVWAQASSGGPLASVTLMQLADQKAQALFDNCFKILDGPNAPDLAIRELDRQLVISLENTRNEKVELYNEIDPTIPTAIPGDSGTFDTLAVQERSYKFQGYQIYQVADETVSEADLDDPSKAKLLTQIDINDDIGQIVNYTYDNVLNAWVPKMEAAAGYNAGLTHAFVVTQDLFTQRQLANYRPYYYLAVSYAYNNYRPFDPNNASFTQYRPFVQGRNNVQIYSAIPHPQVVQNGGTVLNSFVGEGLEIKRIEGQGNGGIVLEFTQATIDEILNSPDHRAVHPVYQAGRGPINVSIYDPMAVKAGGFQLAFSGISDNDFWFLTPMPANTVNITNIGWTGADFEITTDAPLGVEAGQYIKVSNVSGVVSVPDINGWHQVKAVFGNQIWAGNVTAFAGPPIGGTVSNAVDRSTYSINSINQQLYEPNKIAISASKINGQEPGQFGAPENGFLEATMTFADPDRVWLTGITDVDATTRNSRNWILSGTQSIVDLVANQFLDSNEVYEGVLGGTWAPSALTTFGSFEGAPRPNEAILHAQTKLQYLHSVDLVITNDRSKWTRCMVMELGSSGTVGATQRYSKRKQSSVDKDGRPYTDSSANQAEATLTDTSGMGWFPGYALNVETGDRLNIIFGENSSLTGENSTDMMWNPTSNADSANGKLSFGGMHYIYIVNRDTLATGVQNYDEGFRIDSIFNTTNNTLRRAVYRTISWVNLPILTPGYSLGSTGSYSIPTETRIRIRVKKNYRQFVSEGVAAVNGGNPMYEFEIPGSKEPSKGVSSVASKALDLIRVVPNPYYAYSSYEKTRKDQLDNRVRITNLPSRCTVSIYTLNGTLIRQFKRDVAGDVSSGLAVSEGRDDNQATTLDWDLKNTAGITVASGIYIFHIDAGNLGEQVVKWFGVMRPIDLDSF